MNPATLEKLLIDRKLGELPTETTELLDAYLAGHAEDEAVAREIDRVLETAHAALNQPADAALPPFPQDRIDRALNRPNRRPSATWLRPLSLAAAIALAFMLGMRMSGQAPTDADEFRDVVVVAPSPEESSGHEFWSVRNFVGGGSVRPARNTKRITWTSPLAKPQAGESL